MMRHRSASPEATAELGRTYASSVLPGAVVALIGDLGTGKTQFIGGLCSALGVTVPVTSPTFTLINEYPAPFGAVIHVDLYRIGSRREIAELGLEEYFTDRTVCLIEWAEKLQGLLPPGARVLRFFHGTSERERVIEIPEGEEPLP
jgi:tRNA threonylcarbamoyladenosine biosynthesis protein TsaE